LFGIGVEINPFRLLSKSLIFGNIGKRHWDYGSVRLAQKKCKSRWAAGIGLDQPNDGAA
jgi:hypothetical protein